MLHEKVECAVDRGGLYTPVLSTHLVKDVVSFYGVVALPDELQDTLPERSQSRTLIPTDACRIGEGLPNTTPMVVCSSSLR